MIDVVVPAEQEGTKAVVTPWLRQVGDRVRANDPLVELETDKVAMEVAAPADGVLREIVLGPDSDAGPGDVLGRIGEVSEQPRPIMPTKAGISAAVSSATVPLSRPEVPAFAGTTDGRETRLSPSVKRALKASGLDPASLAGTGHNGRLTRRDVDQAVASGAKPSEPVSGAEVIPHSRMRLAIAENMTRSVATAPHVTAVFEADFSAVAAHRARTKAALEGAGVKLTYTAYILVAAAEAMRAAPAINSRWHPDRLEVFRNVDIGVGTALGEGGLVVPVVRGVEQLSLEGVARRLPGLTDRARDGKLGPEDVRGGTFTVSNHGVSGSLIAAPIIINQPQSAILGVGKLEKRVVVREVDGADALLVRPMAYVSLTIDHRVVDAHQTNAWLSRFVEVLEGWPAG